MQLEAVKKLLIEKLAGLYEATEAESILLIVLEDIFGYTRKDLLLNKSLMLPEAQLERLNEIVTRLCSGEPVQYIVGHTSFMGLTFKVNAHVLIPRPETEELVDLIIQDLKQSALPEPKIMDIGTGSGCIPIAIKKHVDKARVYAMDISPEALEVAKHNATINRCSIHWMLADILEWDLVFAASMQFDVIVSNPPYITHTEQQEMHLNVLQYEPHLALFVEDQAPLLFYETIASFALTHLAKGGRLYFEVNRNFGQEVKELLQKKGFKDILLKQDLQGADRMVRASL
ncbi:peptide chain release factor N(5)-glutamine methyltransferase [Olivibacter sp. XZL3]|uniref:peptide chain release factor N(5)-glutamine methyltransferase n=1 Tax=Olivibacter sp. XZL3 TaxID=1735116 RepID=UPI0010662745|nr:peptide chain release factor N(5)-glutamine methyltransferase [Olivibacter sp. XZL3]